jgi:hypothetical protein
MLLILAVSAASFFGGMITGVMHTESNVKECYRKLDMKYREIPRYGYQTQPPVDLAMGETCNDE